jgi:predicted glycoside hydrolase/deacetylase ChbG (UPF0249 family)
MKKILFRADDLGYSEGVNHGIAKSVFQGLIRNVGVMTNMDAVEHGLALLKDTAVCLGLHTSISSGKPLTDPQKIPCLVDENGMFKKSSVYSHAAEDLVVLHEVIMEIEAQYERFVELTGRKPAYLDGHAVASNNFFKGLEIVAEKYKLKFSPIPNNIKDPVYIGNTEVFMHGGSSKQLSPEECLYNTVENAHDGTCNMIVYHPGYLDAYILQNSSLSTFRPFETQMLCDPKNKDYLQMKNVVSITYEDL